MTAAIFDTLKYAKKAKVVGFTEIQAEFQVEEIAKIVNEQIITKKDIDGIKRDIDSIKKDIKELGNKLTANLTIRFGSMLVVAVTVLSILMTIIHK